MDYKFSVCAMHVKCKWVQLKEKVVKKYFLFNPIFGCIYVTPIFGMVR